VDVCRDPAGGKVFVRTASAQLRASLLTSTAHSARVALVPQSALLLGGDAVRIELTVGAHCMLEIVEPGGTVAYDMRGGSASWDVRIVVGPHGRLVWHGQPFVVASGAEVLRSSTIDLGIEATCLMRETILLGRDSEGPGRATTRTTVHVGGAPVLVEQLELGQPAQVPGILGSHRVVDQVLDLRPDADGGSDGLLLEGSGVLHRRLGWFGHDASLHDVWALARAAAPLTIPVLTSTATGH
jgi:urease accessory protein